MNQGMDGRDMSPKAVVPDVMRSNEYNPLKIYLNQLFSTIETHAVHGNYFLICIKAHYIVKN